MVIYFEDQRDSNRDLPKSEKNWRYMYDNQMITKARSRRGHVVVEPEFLCVL